MTSHLMRVWNRLRRFRSDSDFKDELRVHMELHAEDNLARGMSYDEAARQARLRLGGTQSILESVRDQELLTRIEGWYRDLFLGFRHLRKNPVFCFTSILTIALGVGANTAVFSVLYGLLLRSLPVHDPGQLVHISLVNTAREANDGSSFISYSILQELSKDQHSFNGISGWSNGFMAIPDRDGTLRLYDAGLITGNAFSLLGIAPYLGRFIAPSDDVHGSSPQAWPVVLSYGFWQSRFGGDPRVIGKQVRIWSAVTTVVGVAPPSFHGVWPGTDPKVYLPLRFGTPIGDDKFFCSAIARLQPGVSIAMANAKIAVEQQRLLRLLPMNLQRAPEFEKVILRVAPARTGLPTFFVFSYSQPLFLLQGLVIIVFVLCSVNVGGLMMAKVDIRLREFAVRIALGAARWRLIRQCMMESLMIAGAGAAVGAIAAWYGSELLLRFFRDPKLFEGMSVHPDGTVFLVTGALAALSSVFFGTLPALRAGRAQPGVFLKSRTRVGGRRQIAGRTVVPMQVALSVVLVTVATVLSQSLIQLRNQRTGFDAVHVTIQTPPFNNLPQSGDARLDVYQRMVDRIQQMPGVRSAAVTWYTPVTGEQSSIRVQSLDHTRHSAVASRLATNDVGPGYFRTMETTILSGREFRKEERQRNVCILNLSAARYLFPYGPALGAYVRTGQAENATGTNECRVVGIAQDAVFATLREAHPRTIYFPITDADGKNFVFLMNSATKAQAVAAYRTALKEIAPSIPVVLFATMQEQVDAELGTQRLITALSNLFAVLALFLSALGLYGLLSSSVAQRTAEIGVRMALGAGRSAVLRMIFRDAMLLFTAGVLAGSAALIFVLPFVKSMLYQVSANNPNTLAAIALPLAAVAFIAAMLPARRASSVDPIGALRVE